MDAAPPLADGRYRLLGVLGQGGMATVYRGHDARLDIERAIKVLSPEMTVRAPIRARFETEARTMARLHHPNIVSVQDVGADDGRVYMVMELVAGGSLIDRVDADGPMAPAAACDAVIAILAALSVAHARGVVHRDIKPHNVLVGADGAIKVTDFGIAHVADSPGLGTRTGTAMGTWAYMAPEQRNSAKHVDGRADLYATGATLFVLLTRLEPFDLYASEQHDELFRGIPAPLVELLKRSTRFRPEDRYQTAEEMLAAARLARAALDEEATTLEEVRGAPVRGPSLFGPTAPPSSSPRNPSTPSGTLAPERPTAGATLLVDEDDDLVAPPGNSPVAPMGAPAAGGLGLAAEPAAPLRARPFAAPAPAADPAPIGVRAPAGRTAIPDAPSLFVEPAAPTDAPARRAPGRAFPVGGAIAALVVVLGLAGAAGAWSVWGGPSADATPVATPRTAPRTAPAAPAPVPGPLVADPEAAPDVAPDAAPDGRTLRIPEVAKRGELVPPGGVGARPLDIGGARKATSPDAAPAAPTGTAAPAPTVGAATTNAAAAVGTVFVNSQPWANVSVDGKSVGQTGWKGTLAVGPHTLDLTTEDGRTKRLPIDVKENDVNRLCWDFAAEATCAR